MKDFIKENRNWTNLSLRDWELSDFFFLIVSLKKSLSIKNLSTTWRPVQKMKERKDRPVVDLHTDSVLSLTNLFNNRQDTAGFMNEITGFYLQHRGITSPLLEAGIICVLYPNDRQQANSMNEMLLKRACWQFLNSSLLDRSFHSSITKSLQKQKWKRVDYKREWLIR